MWRGASRKPATAVEHVLNTAESFGGVPFMPGDRVKDFETRNFGWRVLMEPRSSGRRLIAKE